MSWCEKVLTPHDPLGATRDAGDVLAACARALEGAGLLRRLDAGGNRLWALEPSRFQVTSRVAEMRCARSPRSLVVAESEADLWTGVPCLDLGAQDEYAEASPRSPTWFGRLYREMVIRRIVAAEHTALLSREARERIQTRFADPNPKPWEPNLVSATPTLEMGIDIGDLSTVVLCSVPPAQANYVQRVGRAGRRDGNALSLTIATGQPHDLYFYAEPEQMMAGGVAPPGVFLNASAVLERQLTAFCLDAWVAAGVADETVPRTIRAVLDNVERAKLNAFPYPFFDFVQRQSDTLLESFLDVFPRDLNEASREYLTRFLQGDRDGYPQLRYRILDRLLEVVKERKSLRTQVDSLKRRIDGLSGRAQDEATEQEIRELSRERTGYQGLLRTLNGRDTFNFLTDEGLIPNYAFPEAGVTLKSVIFRRREREDAPEGPIQYDVYEYGRPGSAALSELAPESEFYAGGRHVRIDQVDLRVSPVEPWRLCPSCGYCERLDVQDAHTVCPRCGDPMWSDNGQRHEMVRLRQVLASTADRRSRIMDDRDDREPLFYTRQLVADFAPAAIGSAYAITKSEMPFGFEYVARSTFREMNFGRLGAAGPSTRFAGVETPRAGFRLCRHCGKVQGADGAAQEHARTCRVRERDDEEAIIDCLYLYREFESEAVRILLPVASGLGGQGKVSSFVAALELGLRGRFGGKVDHLRAMSYEDPPTGPAGFRRYLMLYDTVPGGTGYLKDLMTDKENLLSAFRAAREVLATCECNHDPEKDGCYRCIYAYRRRREQLAISRSAAIEILDSILERAEHFEPVEGLAKVKGNALTQSELEERFLEALRRPEVNGAKATVRPEVVFGKPGHVLSIGGQTYYIEPQADLGPADGVVVPSRPDFLIHPARSGAQSPPIAVFLDGFEFHRKITDEDSVKRMAVVRAGYLQWSLTWHDVEAAFGSAELALDLFAPEGDNDMAAVQRQLDDRFGVVALRSDLGSPSLSLLLRYLAEPEPVRWKGAVFTQSLQLFRQDQMLAGSLQKQFKEALSRLPGQVGESFASLAMPYAVGGRGEWPDGPRGAAEIFAAVPLSGIQSGDPDAIAVAVHLLDGPEAVQSPDYRRTWNGVLKLFNLLQFLPQSWWTTRRGVQRQLYPEFGASPQILPSGPAPVTGPWPEVLGLAAEELKDVLSALADAGAPVPEVGFELTTEAGEVLAEAELGWPGMTLAVLMDEQEHARDTFETAGWTVFAAHQPGLADALRSAMTGEQR